VQVTLSSLGCLVEVLMISAQVLRTSTVAAQHRNGAVSCPPPRYVDGRLTDCSKWSRWGNQRMTKALPLLEGHGKFLFPICKLLEKHVYDRIQAGRPLA
jgi:hypothetical protein